MLTQTIIPLTLSSLLALPLANAADIDVTIDNLSHGIHFAPLLISAHDNTSQLFQTGTTASANLRIMAECGDISGLLSDLGGADMDTLANPAAGLLAPGQSHTSNLITQASNSHLSIVAMMLPTNDGFVGADDILIPTTAGSYTYYLNAYDAGTEGNNELIDSSGCSAGMAGIPAAPGADAGTGGSGVSSTDSNVTVHIHRGVLGDSNSAGGNSELDSTIHRWQNPIAKMTITVN